jgi:hypothetical protein
MARPMVTAGWAKGDADLRRGPSGEVIWERGEWDWFAGVIDFGQAGLEGHPPPNFEAHGFEFYLSGPPEAPLLEGCTMDAEGHYLVILNEAI